MSHEELYITRACEEYRCQLETSAVQCSDFKVTKEMLKQVPLKDGYKKIFDKDPVQKTSRILMQNQP